MGEPLSKEAKKETMKDIIRKLHQGLSAEEAKERFEKEVGNVSSSEIADIEQTLIDEGLSPEEIKKFCNVHALIFQSALEQSTSKETSPSHPVTLFKQENREIEKVVDGIRQTVGEKSEHDLNSLKNTLKDQLLTLKGIDIHYERKEQLLFPFLEKKGFTGPSKVMWGKDNEIRDLLKNAMASLENVTTMEAFEAYREKGLNPALEEVLGMISKEEDILFPNALERLDAGEWVEILKESDDVGYVFIRKPEETEVLVKNLQESLLEEAVVRDNSISLPTGTLKLDELMSLLSTLPVDLTFVDKDDTVKFFSDSKDRIFRRTRSIIGRKVQFCHPPQSLDAVERILTSFKEGKADSYDFWINLQNKLVYIRYFALRDKNGSYLGTIEVTQDITNIKELHGEKRLLFEKE